MGVEHTQAVVERLECRFDAVVQVRRSLVTDVVISPEDLTLVPVINLSHSSFVLRPFIFILLSGSPNQQRCQAYAQQCTDHMSLVYMHYINV